MQIERLQWGRDLSVAEIPVGPGEVAGLGQASMGPRPFGRGDNLAKAIEDAGNPASMGPRPFGRGDGPDPGPQGAQGQASMGPRPFGRGDGAPGHLYR